MAITKNIRFDIRLKLKGIVDCIYGSQTSIILDRALAPNALADDALGFFPTISHWLDPPICLVWWRRLNKRWGQS